MSPRSAHEERGKPEGTHTLRSELPAPQARRPLVLLCHKLRDLRMDLKGCAQHGHRDRRRAICDGQPSTPGGDRVGDVMLGAQGGAVGSGTSGKGRRFAASGGRCLPAAWKASIWSAPFHPRAI
jgi:hypothetical protein